MKIKLDPHEYIFSISSFLKTVYIVIGYIF
jgi:hypothetical protein